MTRISSIARPIDPRYPTNRAIVILTVAVTVMGAIVQRLGGQGWIDGGLWGLGAGLAVFLAWALCRELDPDRALAAFVAAGVALVGLLIRGDLPSFGALLWLLLAIRIVNRTVGLPATAVDSLGVLGLGGWLTTQGNWGYGVTTVVALLLDALLPAPHRRQWVFAALGAAGVSLLLILRGAPGSDAGPSLRWGLAAAGMALTFVPVMIEAGGVESVGDETGEKLHGTRVRAGQAVALLAGIQAAFWGGLAGLVALMPLWAAALGATIYWLSSKALRR